MQIMGNNDDKSAAPSRAASTTNNLMEETKDHDHEVEATPGRAINFAEKTHYVLANRECRDAIAWLPSGHSFCITNNEKFVKIILPKFFKSRASFNSFERRLKTWGFHKIDTTSNLYIFSHESFGQDSWADEELKVGIDYAHNIMKQLRVALSNPQCQPFISRLPSRRSFCINHKDEFIRNMTSKHFGESNFCNFVIRLKNKEFKCIQTADFIGDAVHSHELFQIGRPDLCRLMHRMNDSNHWRSLCSTDASEMVVGSETSLPSAAASGAASRSVLNSSLYVPHVNATYLIPARGLDMPTGGMMCSVNPGIDSSQIPVGRMMGSMSSAYSLLQGQAMSYPSMGHCSGLDFWYPSGLAPNATFATNQQYPLMQYAQTQAKYADAGFLINQQSLMAQHGAAEGTQQQPMFPSATRRLSNSMLDRAFLSNQQCASVHHGTAQGIIQQPIIPNVARRQSDLMLQLDSAFAVNQQYPMLQHAQAQGTQQQPTAPAVARGSITGPSPEYHYDRKVSTTSQSLVQNGRAQDIQQLPNAADRRVSCPNHDAVAHTQEHNKMKMAMLDIETELLRVKEMKLLTMQCKLKLSLETEEQE